MAISLTNETKNSLSVTLESKDNPATTWDNSFPRVWNDAGTWDVPGLYMDNEAKNSLTLTNETKN